MSPADNLKRLFKNAELRVNPDTDEQVFKDVLQAQKKNTENLPFLPERIWRIIMKNQITKLAAAAIVIIACLIGLSFWRTTGSGIALGEVVARIEQVKAFKSARWSSKEISLDPNDPYTLEMRGTQLISHEYGIKTIYERREPNGEWTKVKESYMLLKKNAYVSISHQNKSYAHLDRKYDAMEQPIESAVDPLGKVKRMQGLKYERIGRSTINGIEVEGFRTTDPNWLASKTIKEVDVKIWVDIKSLMPIRYEYAYSSANNLYSGVANYQWDVPIDASEFDEPQMPDGYIDTTARRDSGSEVNTVKFFELCGLWIGKYPENVTNLTGTVLRSALEKSETSTALRAKKVWKELTQDELSSKLEDVLMPQGFILFYLKLLQDKMDPAYYGNIVTPNDTDKVLLRWKVSDNQYRVIYGDLHAETVTKEKLAELEKALTK